jgi:hypothetical protein
MDGFACVDDLMRRVKQRLGGNAAAIEADAAELFLLFDEDDFLAQVRRIKRRRITAGPAPTTTISVLIESIQN